MKSVPLKTRLKLLTMDVIAYVTTRADGTVNRRLFNLLHSTTPAPATKCINPNRTVVSTVDIPIDPSRNLWFRLFTPKSDLPRLPLILYFHGGGFTKYAPDTVFFDDLCSHLAAAAPAVVASVNYRLAPDHKCPSQYDDAFDALKFIDSRNHAVLPENTDLTKCFVAGDSAGGNIAHHLTVRAVNRAEEFDKIRIASVVLLQPFFGGRERTEAELRLTDAPMLCVELTDSYWRDFLPEGADRDHPAANVVGGGGDLERFPASLVVIGGNDPLQDWDRRYVEWLRGCRKRVVVADYPNAFHGFYAFPEMAEFAMLIDDVAKFVREEGNSS